MAIDNIRFTVNFPSDFLFDSSGMSPNPKPTWIVPVQGSFVTEEGLFRNTQITINVALENERATSMSEVQQKAKEIVSNLFRPDLNVEFYIK
ncbi:hypothetical protein MTZ49_11310 [Entomomonas sp. E2T0]|uniref:hypothetical protein n=1 Tax=Entomomonas sp. E2T0 TaxID=2930213 RepID=UPI0022282E67|nr:hypothetical protein [Entomomonas sp. E2T0]UYZ83185.1 hypothetical protein MTZ49_11310 [Entomomonas sp. E2T0]